MATVNMLRGRPGAGKGYEGVAYHIIPALKRGVKVITNMELNVEHFVSVFGEDVRPLIDCRPSRVVSEDRWFFSRVEDYQDDWVHPETGQRAFFVIDECHKPLRKGDELRLVEEWFAEARHSGNNVLLMTQGTRKVNPNILDLVQLTYLCSKVSGNESQYYRKVIDGLRGEPMNTDIRTYESWVYPFYKSHTKSDVSVQEATSFDVKSINSHWIFKTSKFFLIFGFLLLAYLAYSYFDDSEPVEPPVHNVSVVEPLKNDFVHLQDQFDSMPSAPDSVASQAVSTMYDSDPRELVDHPYQGFNISLKGQVRFKDHDTYLISFAQNGQAAFMLSSDQLLDQGYEMDFLGECLIKLTYKDVFNKFITCGFHTQSIPTPLTSG